MITSLIGTPLRKKLNPGIEDHDREHLAAKSSYYNTRYQADNGILAVTKIAKDWNELAKLAQQPATMDQQLEKPIVVRMEKLPN